MGIEKTHSQRDKNDSTNTANKLNHSKYLHPSIESI